MDFSDARPRLPALTSLRFFAAFHVVIFHFQAMQIFIGPAWFQKLSSIGYVGVSFFFVLSAFILVYTYAGRPMILKNFWRARFARIYPAYAFSLLVTALFFFYAVLTMNIPFFVWAKAHLKLASALVLSLLQAWVPPAALTWNAVAWSLSVEAFFYVLFPFLLLVLVRRSQPQLLLIAAVSWLTSLVFSGSYVVLNPDRLSIVNADVLGAFWLNCGFLFLRSRRESKLASLLVLSGIAALVVVVFFNAAIPYPILHTALLAPAFAAIVYGFALRPNWGTILENPWLVLCGDASYSLYLLHSMIVGMYFHSTTGQLRYQSPMGILVFVLIAVSISALVYRFIEEPARRKLNPRRRPQLGSIETQPPLQAAPA